MKRLASLEVKYYNPKDGVYYAEIITISQTTSIIKEITLKGEIE